MTRTFRRAGLLASVAFGVFGQSPSGPQAFDVASVKASPIGRASGEGSELRERLDNSPDSIDFRNASLSSCLQWAYSVKEFQISGPGWLTSERYDIAAKAAAPLPAGQLRMMLRALVAERFQVALHRETRELPVYALMVGKSGPKIREVKGDGKTAMNLGAVEGGIEFRQTSMAELAARLTGKPFRLDRPVLDKTALDGTFNFTIKLAENNAELKSKFERGNPDPSDLSGSLQEIGLKLEPQKGQVEMLVIDHAEKVPTGN
jgi:uncharacterized protein (TIGR03435 family)